MFRAKKHGIIVVLGSVAETSHGGIRSKSIRFFIQIFICSFKNGTKKFEPLKKRPECNCLYCSRLVHHACAACVAQNIDVGYYVHSCCTGFNAKDRVGFRRG